MFGTSIDNGFTPLDMTQIATLLKNEISRVARKEIRSEIQALKQASGAYRTEIAALKRRVQALEQQVKRLGKAQGSAQAAAAPEAAQEESGGALRFSATRLKAQRQRMGLSAREFGLLVGASDQSIYKWEEGHARPRRDSLAAIAATRKLGKREVAARLAALGKAARD